MKHKVWELTDDEVAECGHTGCSIGELQEAKKRGYIANGGIILNPDALEDLCEALKAVRSGGAFDGCPLRLQDLIVDALAKAEVK